MPTWQDVSPLAIAGLSLLAGYWLGRWRDNAKVAHERRAQLLSKLIEKCHQFFSLAADAQVSVESFPNMAIEIVGLSNEIAAYVSPRTNKELMLLVELALDTAAEVQAAGSAGMQQALTSGSRKKFYKKFYAILFHVRRELGTVTIPERIAHLPGAPALQRRARKIFTFGTIKARHWLGRDRVERMR